MLTAVYGTMAADFRESAGGCLCGAVGGWANWTISSKGHESEPHRNQSRIFASDKQKIAIYWHLNTTLRILKHQHLQTQINKIQKMNMIKNVKKIKSNIRSKISVFTYNFGWSDYIYLFDGWSARSAAIVPVIGYLIIFNDGISNHLSFNNIAGPEDGYLNSKERLKLIYFGLIGLGVSSILYRIRRPYIFKLGTDEFEYVERGLRHFIAPDYIDLHHTIRNEGHYTRHGKYSDQRYEEFYRDAFGERDQSGKITTPPRGWVEVKSQHEYLLRSMLIENFFRNNVNRRISMTFCLLLSVFGYFLLAIPSLDLFLRILFFI